MTSGFAIFVSVFFLADRSDRVDGTENKLKGTSNHLPVGQPHKMHDVFFFQGKIRGFAVMHRKQNKQEKNKLQDGNPCCNDGRQAS